MTPQALASIVLLLTLWTALMLAVLKLYTEILKDARFEGRAKREGHDGGRRL